MKNSSEKSEATRVATIISACIVGVLVLIPLLLLLIFTVIVPAVKGDASLGSDDILNKEINTLNASCSDIKEVIRVATNVHCVMGNEGEEFPAGTVAEWTNDPDFLKKFADGMMPECPKGGTYSVFVQVKDSSIDVIVLCSKHNKEKAEDVRATLPMTETETSKAAVSPTTTKAAPTTKVETTTKPMPEYDLREVLTTGSWKGEDNWPFVWTGFEDQNIIVFNKDGTAVIKNGGDPARITYKITGADTFTFIYELGDMDYMGVTEFYCKYDSKTDRVKCLRYYKQSHIINHDGGEPTYTEIKEEMPENMLKHITS